MTQPSMETTVLDAVVLVQLDIRGSDLSVKVDPKKDLPGANLPPSKVMSTGVKHYVDPGLKTPFMKLKKRAERACAEVGFPLLKGWALPKNAARRLHDDLKTMAVEYTKEADDLERTLPGEFVKWEEANAGWEHLLTDRPTPAEIRSRYRFRHAMYRMRPAGDDMDDVLNDAIGVTRGSLLEAILDDVATTATDILKRVFEGKSQVSGRVITGIGTMGKKLSSFSLIDPLVLPVASMIGEVLGNIGGGGGMLSVTHTSALRGLLELLSDPVKLRHHGALQRQAPIVVVEGNTTGDIVQETIPDVEVAIPPPKAKVPAPASALLF